MDLDLGYVFFNIMPDKKGLKREFWAELCKVLLCVDAAFGYNACNIFEWCSVKGGVVDCDAVGCGLLAAHMGDFFGFAFLNLNFCCFAG